MKKIIILFLIIFIIAGGIFIWWTNGQSPVNPNDKTEKIFVIKSHENLRTVGYNLKHQGLIRDPIVFFLLLKEQKLDGKIQAGNFHLSPSLSALEIAQALTHGILDIWITIPEGDRATEIADVLQNKIPSYKVSWKDKLIPEEGYLFPDTYLIPTDADINTIISLMKNNFEKKYLEASGGETVKLTKTQAVILASIVQREGKNSDDMKLVASVLENRLNLGMPLQVDASIQYALGYQPSEKSWWKKILSLDDLKINSLYNTYLNTGLPPTPISNPGLYALKAVLNPSNTNYLYYVSDSTGKLHFASTLEEHNANISKYTQ